MANEGAAPAAVEVAEAPDDGFDTPEERQAFAEMQSADRQAPPPPESPEPAPPAEPEPTNAAQAAPAAAQSEDDGGDDEPAASGQQPKPGEERTPRRVSFSRYKRETEDLRKQIETRDKDLAETKAMQNRLDERLRIINEAMQTPPQNVRPEDDDPPPDPEKDIFGHNAWLMRQLQKTNERLSQFEQVRQEEIQQSTAERQVNDAYLADAETFAQQNPNFVPAYQFLMNSRVLELAEYYFSKDLTAEGTQLTAQERQQIAATIADEERQLVQSALRQNKSPAQRVFALAQRRGFRPEAPKPAQNGANGAAPANGAANGAAKATPGALNGGEAPQPSVRDEISKIKQGTEASLSLSAGGAAPAMTLTAQKLVDMSDEQFGQWMDLLSPAELKQLMGN